MNARTALPRAAHRLRHAPAVAARMLRAARQPTAAEVALARSRFARDRVPGAYLDGRQPVTRQLFDRLDPPLVAEVRPAPPRRRSWPRCRRSPTRARPSASSSCSTAPGWACPGCCNAPGFCPPRPPITSTRWCTALNQGPAGSTRPTWSLRALMSAGVDVTASARAGFRLLIGARAAGVCAPPIRIRAGRAVTLTARRCSGRRTTCPVSSSPSALSIRRSRSATASSTSSQRSRSGRTSARVRPAAGLPRCTGCCARRAPHVHHARAPVGRLLHAAGPTGARAGARDHRRALSAWNLVRAGVRRRRRLGGQRPRLGHRVSQPGVGAGRAVPALARARIRARDATRTTRTSTSSAGPDQRHRPGGHYP